MEKNKRVIVTRSFVGLCHMQVCATKDATDDEILDVCNTENPSGTANGWSTVYRNGEWLGQDMSPVKCADDENRLHILVGC